MKIKELKRAIEDASVSDEERDTFMRGLVENQFSIPSKAELKKFQTLWDGSRPYREFVKAQNSLVLDMIFLETSPIGAVVRAATGMPPLSLEDEIIPAKK